MSKKWFVRVPIYCDALIKVEAETEEAAKELASQQHAQSLCHQCADHYELGEPDDSGDITAEQCDE